jgi:hypothetical protein
MAASNEYIEYVLANLYLAAEFNRHTPGRQGNVVSLTANLAEEVLVTGDLHGHRRNFNQLVRLAALDENPRRHLVLQEACHGGPTYPRDSGCMSHTILEDIAVLKNKHPEQVHFILGNHELAEMTDYPIQKNRQMLNLQFRQGLQVMYGAAAEKIQEAYRRFLQTCPLAVRLASGVFISHSIPEHVAAGKFDATIFDRRLTIEDMCEQGGVFLLTWGRDYRETNARAFAQLVGAQVLINGHEPCYEGFIAPNNVQIILDCCGPQAAYVILPVETQLTQAEILKRVEKLEA